MKNLVIITTIIAAFGLSLAHADEKKGEFAKKHPRRAEVLKRDKNEKNKNAAAFKQGEITKTQEKQLNREDRQIKRQEQAQAKANGGYITKAQQRKDNQELNKVNEQRQEDIKNDATPPATTGN